ncbi:MAG TPA: hypothetical protein VNZ64_15675 [Candidatus Acidoferrum sp.]|jgi:hypothetical protein|nr:hypothetical protein [Candidatus Acidoferrum sp.]
MQTILRYLVKLGSVSTLTAVTLLLPGCASTPDEKQSSANQAVSPTGVTLHKDKDIQGVWLANGFAFKGYDAVYIGDTVFKAEERSNEVEARGAAMRVLPFEMADAIKQTSLFPVVTTRAEDLKPDTKTLKFANTITEYQKGGGGARYFAGMFGGGQPVIKVRGEVRDGDSLVCVYEIRRSGESAGARMNGVFMKDEDIQRNDIQDLAKDFADFIKRTAATK